jgi:hypothetical protein
MADRDADGISGGHHGELPAAARCRPSIHRSAESLDRSWRSRQFVQDIGTPLLVGASIAEFDGDKTVAFIATVVFVPGSRTSRTHCRTCASVRADGANGMNASRDSMSTSATRRASEGSAGRRKACTQTTAAHNDVPTISAASLGLITW